MRILVTGHKGYIGKVLAPFLIAAGHRVVGLDSDLFGQCTFGLNVDLIPELRKDIRDVQLSDLEGFDAIVHLAGLANDPLGDLNPTITYEINHAASVRLAQLAKKGGTEIIVRQERKVSFDEYFGGGVRSNGVKLSPFSHNGVPRCAVIAAR